MSEAVEDVHSVRAPTDGRRLCPTNAFVAFKKEEIEQSIEHRFEQQVDRYPDRIAVKSRSRELTYAALNHLANRVARAIVRELGEGEEPVVLLVGHGAGPLLAILGALKAGKAYVPGDPLHPKDRVSLILNDSGARLIVTDAASAPLARELAGAASVVNMDEMESGVSGENLGLPVAPDRLAHIMYTSGSTGQPKGVPHSHRNVLHNTMKFGNGLHICPDDRLTLLPSYSFGASVSNIFGALLNGAALFPFDLKEEGLSPLADWLIRQQITIYRSVPTVFRHFCAVLTGEEHFPELRLIRLSGEPVYKRDVQLYRQHFPTDCLLSVGLGATELPLIRHYFVDHATEITTDIVPVGYEVEDTEVLLLDDDSEEVGFGCVGEIAVRSKYLTAGYWQDPALTGRTFLSSPEGGGERIWRSGDLGYMLPDGCLVHLGRKDSQVKVRGHRIEVIEGEAALSGLASIKEAAVVAREDRSGEQRLVAYLVPVSQPGPSPRELRAFLREKLPDYMIPSAFVKLDALPLTATGKLDRMALPAAEKARPAVPEGMVAPRDGLEQTLAAIWSDLLDVEHVGVTDDFLDLGGDSLLAARMVAEVEKVLGIKLPLAVLIEAPTLERLAAIVRERDWERAQRSLVALRATGSRPPLFCIHSIGGEVLCYASLARWLGPDQPVYGLQAKGMDGREEPLDHVEAMAAHYIREIQTVCPDGPYNLLGYSGGGSIAFEIAWQLSAAGHQVDLLAIVDHPAPKSGYWGIRQLWRPRFAASFLRHVRDRFRIFRSREPAVKRATTAAVLRRVGRAARRIPTRLMRALGLVPTPPPTLPDWIPEAVPGRLHVALPLWRAFQRYVPPHYYGRVTVFRGRPEGLVFATHDPEMGWGKYAVGGVEVAAMPCPHETMLDDANARVLAEKVAECLAVRRRGSDGQNPSRVLPGIPGIQCRR